MHVQKFQTVTKNRGREGHRILQEVTNATQALHYEKKASVNKKRHLIFLQQNKNNATNMGHALTFQGKD